MLNVEIFVNSGYLDKNLLFIAVALCKVKQIGQTCPVLFVAIINLPHTFFISPTAEVGGAICHQD